MSTLFDFVTVGCFLAMAGVFFIWTERDNRTLLHFMVSAVAFAVANQVGNAGSVTLAWILVVAGAAYVFLIVRKII